MSIKRNRISKGILGLIITVGIVVGSASNVSAQTFFDLDQELDVTNDGIASLDYLRYDGRGRETYLRSLETPLNSIRPGMGTLLWMAAEIDWTADFFVLDQGPN
ncbi:hypothetical protein Mal15_40370 [Stieleria maiorica]|uniref:Uncharacterized protein n=1 Tax=Stieleria maiorica TaxID=2795974 RepID=A0A5B9MJ22_9BACT|nr:hypothetical protein [Stieleria maiorica]QEF99970.1 hypothetical protein Mal15_40370 [Stieleria maiorica]